MITKPELQNDFPIIKGVYAVYFIGFILLIISVIIVFLLYLIKKSNSSSLWFRRATADFLPWVEPRYAPLGAHNTAYSEIYSAHKFPKLLQYKKGQVLQYNKGYAILATWNQTTSKWDL